MKRALIIFGCIVIVAAVITGIIKCNTNASLPFEEVKLNTPDKVAEELGLKNMPKFHYVGNQSHAGFNYDFWDCVVEYEFEDSLSTNDKREIIRQVAQQDDLHWMYKNIPSDCVAEYYNIRYGERDTTRYNIVITTHKIYVAYDGNFNKEEEDRITMFAPSEYHLIGVSNAYIGPDSSHEWTIQLKEPYTRYLNRFEVNGEWKCENTKGSISFRKEEYINGFLQSIEEVEFRKSRNVAIINYDTF